MNFSQAHMAYLLRQFEAKAFYNFHKLGVGKKEKKNRKTIRQTPLQCRDFAKNVYFILFIFAACHNMSKS